VIPVNIVTQLRNRLNDHERLMFRALLDPQKFPMYREMQNFPNAAYSSLEESYGPHFELPRLKTELTVTDSMSDFEGKSTDDLLHFPQQNRLIDSMHKSCLVLTIPVSTASVERTFSALKRIKTYSRNTTGQARLSALALISIEK
jgi:hypothetical protein